MMTFPSILAREIVACKVPLARKSIDPLFYVCLEIPHTHISWILVQRSKLAGQVPQMDKQDVPWIVNKALSCSRGI